MKHISAAEAAKRWGLSDRIVRRYCSEGRIDGAILIGKTWSIPHDSPRPGRKNSKRYSDNTLLRALKEEKAIKLKGRIYHKIQIEFTYNSNRIEGSKLSEDQTRLIFETNTVAVGGGVVNIDDLTETKNHFRCIDFVIDNAERKLTENMVKELHFMLKTGTSDSDRSWFKVGDYKALENEVGGEKTCPPGDVNEKMNELLEEYNSKGTKTLEDIVCFHQRFEKIHPFQDGNGRVGRLIMFKECLSNDVVPFIIDEEHRWYYYRGLKEWDTEKGFLLDTCLSAQDEFRKWLGYFGIEE